MTEELLRVVQQLSHSIEAFSLVFFRVGAALFVMPVFGELMIPMRVRLTAAFALSLAVYPVALPTLIDRNDSYLLQQAVSEVTIGLVLGLLLRFQIMAIQIAATIAAQATSLAQLLGGANIDPQPAIAMTLYLAALALAVELDLHVQIVRMFALSYNIVGPGKLAGADLAGVISRSVAVCFEFAVVLAAPFVAVSLVYNLTLGIINRAMPQLMVAFVGAPAITLGALVLLALTAPLLLAVWIDRFQLFLARPFGGH